MSSWKKSDRLVLLFFIFLICRYRTVPVISVEDPKLIVLVP
jgi:hypothetical protein